MKKILLALVVFFTYACKKDDYKSCWECKAANASDTAYRDWGCELTQKDIEGITFTDYAGNPLPNPKCRRK